MAKVKYYGELRRITGKQEEEISADNLKILINEIQKRYGVSAYRQAKTGFIAVDGYKVIPDMGMNTTLNSESIVCFYPICAGG